MTSISQIDEDGLMYGQPGQAGILGFSPTSDLFAGFLDPVTLKGYYSIALSESSVGDCNVTVGGTGIPSNAEKTNILASSVLGSQDAFPLTTIQFGELYQN